METYVYKLYSVCVYTHTNGWPFMNKAYHSMSELFLFLKGATKCQFRCIVF